MNWKKINEQPLSKEKKSRESVIVEVNHSDKNEHPSYRGSTRIHSSLSRIAFALIDINSKKRWVNRLSEHHLIEGDLHGMEFSTYEHYNLAWPVSDRDYVLAAKWTIDHTAEDLWAQLEISSINHKNYPLREDRIRGDLQKLVFSLN